MGKIISGSVLRVTLAVKAGCVDLILEFDLKIGLENKFGNSKHTGRM